MLVGESSVLHSWWRLIPGIFRGSVLGFIIQRSVWEFSGEFSGLDLSGECPDLVKTDMHTDNTISSAN